MWEARKNLFVMLMGNSRFITYARSAEKEIVRIVALLRGLMCWLLIADAAIIIISICREKNNNLCVPGN